MLKSGPHRAGPARSAGACRLFPSTPAAHPPQEYAIATIVAHEVAHSWFGDLVTLADWNELWLNEGAATYFEYAGAAGWGGARARGENPSRVLRCRARSAAGSPALLLRMRCARRVRAHTWHVRGAHTGADSFRPEYRYFDYFYAREASPGLESDADPASHPLSKPGAMTVLDDIDNQFDDISYSKARGRRPPRAPRALHHHITTGACAVYLPQAPSADARGRDRQHPFLPLPQGAAVLRMLRTYLNAAGPAPGAPLTDASGVPRMLVAGRQVRARCVPRQAHRWPEKPTPWQS